jgi:Cold shock proteins
VSAPARNPVMLSELQPEFEGVVRMFYPEKGWGAITPDDDDTGSVFVHYTGIVAVGNGRRNLYAGQRVAFDVAYNAKGAIAVNVIPAVRKCAEPGQHVTRPRN